MSIYYTLNTQYLISNTQYPMSYQLEKKQKVTTSYVIGNYHLSSTELAMAEAIVSNTLQSQMTQHGLGTGIYGFIDYSESNSSTQNYKFDVYELTQIELINPVILENSTIIDGEIYSDLGNFSWLSMNLNILCFEIFNKKKDIIESNIIEILTQNNFFPNEKNYWDGIPNVPITIGDIVWVVKSFLQDYSHLEMLNDDDENYVLMPINYLLYSYGFDGILNKCDDTGRTGSVKYFFPIQDQKNQIKARGYRPNFKRREPLRGNLIFLQTK